MRKYQYLREFAEKELKEPNQTIAGVARKAKELYNLQETPEQLRKIISRELNNRPISSTQEIPKPISPSYYQTEPRRLSGTAYISSGRYLVLGCVHVPGHNEAMIDGVIKLLGDLTDLRGLMLIGDFLDLNSLSGHDHGKFTALSGLTLSKEYDAGNKVLDQLEAPLSKNVEKLYLYGNHEDRWKRYMSNMQNAKAPLPSPTEALSLYARGYTVLENWTSDYVKLGSHLELIHGQYYNTHCAKQHIDKFRGSVMFAHTHRIQTYVEGKTAGFNIGWGGDVNHPFFNYAERGTKSQWQNGFAIVTVDEYGDYFVEQVFCYNNKFYYGGKKYN